MECPQRDEKKPCQIRILIKSRIERKGKGISDKDQQGFLLTDPL